MRKHLLLPFLGTACAVLLALSGCREDDALPPAGPASAAAFAGTTLSINPTIQFLSGGQVLYVNGQATGTVFPVSTAQLSGTYTYSPSTNYSSGTMVLTLPAPANTVTLDFKNFQQSNGNVTSFNVGYNGQTIAGTVANGTLTAFNRSSSTPGTTTTTPTTTTPTTPGTTIPTTPSGPNETTAAAIPTAMQGTYELEFKNTENNPPYPAGTKKTFIIGASSLQFDGKTLTNPIFYFGNPLEWIFKEGNLWWAVSKADNGGLNEINLSGFNYQPYYGQFNNRASTSTTTPTTPSTGTTTALAKELEFGSATAGAPYTNGQRIAFTLNRNSTDATKNTLQFSGKTLSNPTVTNSTATIEINTFADGNTRYETVIRDNALYEINVMVGTAFTGQFAAPTTTTTNTTTTTPTTTSYFTAGSTFTLTVSAVTIAPLGGTIPAGVPSLRVGDKVTFTIAASGALTFNGTTTPFIADGVTAVNYTQILSAGNANAHAVYRNTSTGAPTGASLSYTRISTGLPPSVTMITYTLN